MGLAVLCKVALVINVHGKGLITNVQLLPGETFVDQQQYWLVQFNPKHVGSPSAFWVDNNDCLIINPNKGVNKNEK